MKISCGCFSRYAAIFGVLIPVLTIAIAHAKAQDPLRVMSFNIRYGTARDGVNAWPNRRQHVATVIRTFAPDLLGTQETLPFQARQLQEDLAGYQYIGWSRDASADGEQCGIFVRTARFEIIESGQFWLSETPDEKFSKSWDSSLPRVATWVRLKDRSAGDRRLLFLNTHFDHRGETARRESAALLVRRGTEVAAGEPLLITGDFNCGEGSPPWKTLTADTARLEDTFRKVHPRRSAGEGTFNGFSDRAGAERIDWILCSPGWQVTAATIDRSEFGGRFASDHFAVTATLGWSTP
ncbi:MAG: endonuclease/exonuclease/phosphatase family protein [Planctomycetaceae bacterium]